jgi:putative phosphonate catabolism associated alcohol dehydrogenase
MKLSEFAVFTSHSERFELKRSYLPELKEGELLVKVEFTSLCRSDINTYCGKRFEPCPTILGHEIVGRIEQLGNNCDKEDLRGVELKIGDRVTWAIFASNPDSKLSRMGMPQKSNDLFKYGHEKLSSESEFHGGLSEYIILRKNTPIIIIDEIIPLKVASIINCAVSTVAAAIRLAADIKGKNVLISGAGMLGMIASSMCKVNGAETVTVTDIDKDRVDLATRFGADYSFLSNDTFEDSLNAVFHSNTPFDIVLEFSGVAHAMEKTLDLLDFGGISIWVGATYPEREVHFSAEKMLRKLLSIRAMHNYNQQDFLYAVSFIESNYDKFPFSDMIHDNFSLKEVNEAFEYGLKENPFRVGIKID